MATTPELHEPQIAAARAEAWHQAGDPLLTLEAARPWLNHYGLVLFGPRAAALGAPAPSLVEATLGEARSSITPADSDTARTLTARLVGEGSAIPLNLLGGPGDLPDFLVSAQAFPFVFTLRGDKGWKRPPETTGAVKVTPLGLRVYEVLAEKGALTIAEMVSEIGREVTESAIGRALTELWQLLRVLPVLQQGEGETRWELTTARFVKAVKAGANAGQPTALSALASLYLTQVFVATEEEISGFLSPLTARSRVRDVLHGLSAGRQLAEGVVHGKTVLYVPDALPDFAQFAEPEAAAVEAGTSEGDEAGIAPADSDAGTASEAPKERIRRFAGEGASAQDRNLRGKPVKRAGGGDRRPARTDRPRREGASGPRADRGARESAERRPFPPRGDRAPRREGDAERSSGQGPAGDRPSFRKPWEEERGSRPPRRTEGDRPFRPRADGAGRPARPAREGEDRRPPRRESSGGERPPFRRREASPEGQERSAGRGAPARGDRPFRPRAEGGDRPYRARPEGGKERPYRPRPEVGGDRPFRPRPEGGGDRPFRPRPAGGDRPTRPRPEGSGGDRPFRARPAGGDRPFRSRSASPDGGDGGERRPSRRPPSASRGGEGGAPRGDRPRSGFGDRKGPRPGGPGGFKAGAKGPGFGFKKGPSKFAGRTDRPSRPARKPRPEDEP